MNTNFIFNYKIQEIINRLNLKIIFVDMNGKGGGYHIPSDTILIDTSCAHLDRNQVFLHELVHWTQPLHRLNRRTSHENFLLNILNPDIRLTEEFTANKAAIKLANMLGINTNDLETNLKDNYIAEKNFNVSCDQTLIENQVDNVVKYFSETLQKVA